MIKKIFENFKNLDQLTSKIMNYGLKFCFIVCLLSAIILLAYDFVFPLPILYYIGIHLFKISLIFGIEFIICGFVVDSIKKQLI
ncbi:MAG: hypothetical protein HFJ33_05320 [Clostridia bacterium]|nr:hypothetical protein [Clostridia bacterium]